MKLPDVFAVTCPNDCWLAVSPAAGAVMTGRIFDRRRLRAADCGALDVPLVPQIEPPVM